MISLFLIQKRNLFLFNIIYYMINLIYDKSPNVQEMRPKDFKVVNLRKNIEPKYNQPILIVFYAHWCPHCSNPTMVEFVESLAGVLPKKSNVKVGAFNCDYNDEHRAVASNLEVNAFPTIRYINKNRKSTDYRGPTSIKNILQFLVKSS
jgi:thioredoxin-like negative regulator of GroEL